MNPSLVVLLHGVCTFAMVGFMMCIQLVVYPQFRRVDPADFPVYVESHTNRVLLPLALFAPAEMIFAAWLFVEPPAAIGRGPAFVAGLLLALAWVSTAAWFGPLHVRLSSMHDAARIERLIHTNWVRTGLWVARGAMAAWFLWRQLDLPTG